jgi:hypothetical protein
LNSGDEVSQKVPPPKKTAAFPEKLQSTKIGAADSQLTPAPEFAVLPVK